jgi:hypothetical protein
MTEEEKTDIQTEEKP